ncbi:MAG: anthranilate phosphoribosyltransferase, partial [Pseudomonadota bacterium]
MSTLPDVTNPLNEIEAETAFGALLDGKATDDEIGAFLVALS